MAKNTKSAAVVKEENVTVSKELDAMTPEQRLTALEAEHKNISGVMRYLAGAPHNMKTGDIAKYIGKRYQHVNNVLKQPLKKAETTEPAKSE
jgi:hypothetical protein